ncbi:hypothetical protein BSKO_01256 [Bryopsis sp. KO-2023]|nr:hypothetical protein BSKO_01256 [Bryopsis sp. KO-2023]
MMLGVEGCLEVASFFLVFYFAAAESVDPADVNSANSTSLFSCEPREGADLTPAPGSKWVLPGYDFQHRGSELSDGRRAVTASDEECAALCAKTEGCRVWSRFQENTDNQWDRVGNCWIKSSIPYPQKNHMLNSGVIPPKALPEGSCQALNMTGFRHAVPYNNPKLLYASSAHECCGRCHEHNELCFGWTWNWVTHYCSLFGNSLKESEHYMCRNCISGTRIADREALPFECHSEIKGIIYAGTVWTQAEDFLTNTSEECCKMCARIRECKSWYWQQDLSCKLNRDIPKGVKVEFRVSVAGGVAKPKVCGEPEDCALEENVEFSEHNLACETTNVPRGGNLTVESPEECCLRCHEHPECYAFTYTKNDPEVESTGCWLKSGVSGELRVGNCTGICVSGVIRSRVKDSDWEVYQFTLQQARALQKKKLNLSFLAVPLPIFGTLIACCLCGAAAFFFIRDRKRKNLIQESRLKENYKQMRASSLTPSETPNAHQGNDSPPTPIENPPFSPVPVVAQSQLENKLKELSRLKAQMAPAGFESMPRESDLNAISMALGTLQWKFIMEAGRIITKKSIIHFARSKFDRARPVAIVFERGDYTLGTWLQRRTRALDFMGQRNILFRLSSTLHFLHSHKIVHRDIKPGNVVMFSSDLTWKLIDYGCWACNGEEVPIEYTLRYACPEVLSAHGQGLAAIHANSAIAMDMWGLGLLFWEVMAGEPLFGDTISDEEVMAMLLGTELLPFEKNEVLWENIQPMAVQRIIRNLLKRQPSARWPIQKVMAHAFFAPGKDTIEAREGVSSVMQEMTKHIGRIEERILELQEVAVENLKQTTSNVLIISMNFYQISDTSESSSIHPAGVLERHIQGDLKVEEPLFQPNYSLFKREKEDPCAL